MTQAEIESLCKKQRVGRPACQYAAVSEHLSISCGEEKVLILRIARGGVTVFVNACAKHLEQIGAAFAEGARRGGDAMSAPEIEPETARQIAFRMLTANGARLVQAVDQDWQSIADAIEENVKASYRARQSQKPSEAEIETVARGDM